MKTETAIQLGLIAAAIAGVFYVSRRFDAAAKAISDGSAETFTGTSWDEAFRLFQNRNNLPAASEAVTGTTSADLIEKLKPLYPPDNSGAYLPDAAWNDIEAAKQYFNVDIPSYAQVRYIYDESGVYHNVAIDNQKAVASEPTVTSLPGAIWDIATWPSRTLYKAITEF